MDRETEIPVMETEILAMAMEIRATEILVMVMVIPATEIRATATEILVTATAMATPVMDRRRRRSRRCAIAGTSIEPISRRVAGAARSTAATRATWTLLGARAA
jgi:hypothetical protein